MRNRDTKAAQAARKDPQGIAKRIALARTMLDAGDKQSRIMAATKEQTGTAIGGGTLTRLRRQMEKEKRRAESRRQRMHAAQASTVDDAVEVVASVALSKTHAARAASALVDAGVPFAFDGFKLTVGR